MKHITPFLKHLALAGLFISSQLFAVTTTFIEDASAEWNDPSNWSNGVPGAGDDVIIDNNEIATIISGASYTIQSLTLNSGAELELESAGSLTVTGNVTVNSLASLIARGTMSNSGTFTLGDLAEIDLRGSVTINGNLMLGVESSIIVRGVLLITGDVDFGGLDGEIRNRVATAQTTFGGNILNAAGPSLNMGRGLTTFNGNSTQDIPGVTFDNVTFSGTGDKNIASAVTVEGDLNANNAIVNVSGTLTAGDFAALAAGTSTFNYNGSANQSIASFIGNFYNLSTSGGGIKTVISDLTIDNNLVTTSGTELELASHVVTIGGDFVNGAVTNQSTGNTIVNGTFNSTGVYNNIFGDLILNGDAIVNGVIDITNGELAFLGSNPATLSGSSGLVVNDVSVDKPTASLTLVNTLCILPLGTLTLGSSTNLNANGNLILKSDASGYGSVATIPAGSSISGSTTVEGYINAQNRTWWHLSNPVANVPASDWIDEVFITGEFTGNSNANLGGSDNPSMFSYNESATSAHIDSGWTSFPSVSTSETMGVGVGYRIFIRDNLTSASPKTLEVSGTLNQGNIGLPISFQDNSAPNDDGWNFIGNPYPATLSWTDVDKTNLNDANAFVWNTSSQNYQTPTTIAPFQGFWVQAASAHTLNLTESMKSSGAILRGNRTAPKSNSVHISIFDKEMEETFNFAQTSLVINPLATAGFDKALETSLLSRNRFVEIDQNQLVEISSVASNGKNLKENHIPESDEVQTIPLEVEYSNRNLFSITISLHDYAYGNVILVDKFLDTETVFSDELTYDITLTDAPASRAKDRFELKIGATPTSISKNEAISSLEIFPNPSVNGIVTIQATSVYSSANLTITDLIGNVVTSKSISNHNSSFTETLSVKDLEAGIYTVNITANGTSVSQKLIINK